MSRVDTWTKDEDLLLSETVLRHIRQGSTQLKAFDEVGEKLNRSSAGCAFRWNGIVRNNYTEAILFAKKLRNDGKRHKKTFKEKPEPKFKDVKPKTVEVQEVTEQLKAVILEEIPAEKEKTDPNHSVVTPGLNKKMEVVGYLLDLMWELENKPTAFREVKQVIKYVMDRKEA